MYAKWRKCNERCSINTIQSLGLDSSSSRQWKCVDVEIKFSFLSNWGCDYHAVVHKEGRYLIVNLMYRSSERWAVCSRPTNVHTYTFYCYLSLLFLMLHFSRNHRHSAIHKCIIWECKMREERTVLLFLSHFLHHQQQQHHNNVYTKQFTSLTFSIYHHRIAYNNFFYIILIFRLFFYLHAASHIIQFSYMKISIFPHLASKRKKSI